MKYLIAGIALTAAGLAGTAQAQSAGTATAKANALLGRMTLEEKIG